jgi:hypothetical protein
MKKKMFLTKKTFVHVLAVVTTMAQTKPKYSTMFSRMHGADYRDVEGNG